MRILSFRVIQTVFSAEARPHSPKNDQGSEPIKGVRSLRPTVAAIVYHAPQSNNKLFFCFALPVKVSLDQADHVLLKIPSATPLTRRRSPVVLN